MFNNYFKHVGFMFKYLFVKMQSYKIKKIKQKGFCRFD